MLSFFCHMINKKSASNSIRSKHKARCYLVWTQPCLFSVSSVMLIPKQLINVFICVREELLPLCLTWTTGCGGGCTGSTKPSSSSRVEAMKLKPLKSW